MKVYSFITELQTWVTFTQEELHKAVKMGKIDNHPKIKELFNDWVDGRYDEDIQLLGEKVKLLIK